MRKACPKLEFLLLYPTHHSQMNTYLKRRGVRNKYVYFGEDTDLAEKIPGVEDTIVDRIIHQEEIHMAMRQMSQSIG